jgi:hypothetical protein
MTRVLTSELTARGPWSTAGRTGPGGFRDGYEFSGPKPLDVPVRLQVVGHGHAEQLIGWWRCGLGVGSLQVRSWGLVSASASLAVLSFKRSIELEL